MSYIPNEVDIQWARNVLKLLKQNSKLVYPSTGLIYRVDHIYKRLILENPRITVDRFESFVTHQQTIEVFAQIGYMVIEKEEQC